MAFINATGLSGSDSLSFMIIVAIVFWMVSYVIADINVLVFRRRLPKAPRTFKIPFGPLIPIISILGTLFMIWNIDGDPATRLLIYEIDGIIFALLMLYAFLWCKIRLKKPLLKPIPVEEVMAMENVLYLEVRKAKKK